MYCTGSGTALRARSSAPHCVLPTVYSTQKQHVSMSSAPMTASEAEDLSREVGEALVLAPSNSAGPKRSLFHEKRGPVRGAVARRSRWDRVSREGRARGANVYKLQVATASHKKPHGSDTLRCFVRLTEDAAVRASEHRAQRRRKRKTCLRTAHMPLSANVAVRDRVLQALYVLERQLEPSTERGGRCRILGALDGRHRHS